MLGCEAFSCPEPAFSGTAQQSANAECRPMVGALPGVLFTFERHDDRRFAMPYVTEKLFDITGLRPEEVICDAAPLLIRMHPEDVVPFLESAEVSAQTGQPWRSELRINHPDKGEVWIEWLAGPVSARDSVCWQGFMQEIGERKRREAELGATAEIQAGLLRALSDAGLQQMVIENGRIIHVGNRTLARELGFTDAMIDACPPLAQIIHPDDRARVLDYHRRRLAGESVPSTYELGLRSLSGERREFEVSVAVVPDSDPLRIVSVAWEITERKAAQQRMALLERAIDASIDAFFLVDRKARFRYVNATACRTLGYTREELLGMTVLDIDPDISPDALEDMIQNAFSGGVFFGELPIMERRHRTKAGHIFPVQLSTSLVEFQGEHFSLVSARDITERKRMEDTLWESHTLTQAILESSPGVIVFALDRNYCYLAFNRLHREAMQTLWGSDIEIGMSMLDVIGNHPDREKARQGFDRAISGESFVTEESYGDATHVRMHWQTFWSPIRAPGGNVTGLTCFVLNITARQQAEENVRALNARLTATLGAIPDLMFEVDRDGVYLDVWAARPELLSMPKERLIGRTLDEVLPAEAACLAMDALREANRDGVAHGKVIPLRLDTETRWFEHSLAKKPGINGADATFIVLSRDITERKRMEDALREREQELRTLAENLPDVIVRYDQDCRRTYISPIYEQFAGRSIETLIGKTPAEEWALPDGGAGGAAFQAHLLHVLATGKPGTYELAWVDANRQRMLMELRSIPEFDSEGQAIGVLTIARDFSIQREMEDRLCMAASVFQAAREGIVITDPKGHILDVNPSFTRITGFSREQALGQRPAMLSSGLQNRAFYKSMWSTLGATDAWTGELINRRMDGELYTEHLDIVAVRDGAGQLKHYIGIFSDVTQLRQHEQHLRHIAHHDPLTGLPNRLLLHDRLTQGVAIAHREKRMLAVLLIDLDSFKPINDNYGHAAGDRVLSEIARRMTHTVRAVDTVARLGGDEFVVLLSGLSDARECESISRRLLDAIARPVVLDEHTLNLSASIGISLFPSDGDDPDILLRYADQAMYSAKAAGRNQCVFHGEDTRENSRLDGQLIHDLREALEYDQISVHYQPIVDIATGRVVKAEALARWTHPVRGEVSPGVFIPVAESTGLIHAIGDRIFAHAARVAHEWNSRVENTSGEPLRISINRSPRQFFNREGVHGWVNHLNEQAISGEHLTIEITEGLLLDDQPDVIKQLDQLRGLGMKVALDDFGTGYSALSYLKKFEIDILKIDRSFIRDIAEDPSDRAIVESIILMAKRLGIKLVAEGVETREQADLLAAAGCDMAQGYFFARPLPEAAFMAFVLKNGAEGGESTREPA